MKMLRMSALLAGVSAMTLCSMSAEGDDDSAGGGSDGVSTEGSESLPTVSDVVEENDFSADESTSADEQGDETTSLESDDSTAVDNSAGDE